MTEIIIRPACVEDAPGIARVHVDSWRTAYKVPLVGSHYVPPHRRQEKAGP
jgi:hypothetical protein